MANPPGPQKQKGEQFQTILGFRRLIYPGEYHYFQHENRRYFCRVMAVQDEPHRTRHGRTCKRVRAFVSVVQ